ncbi:MAG: 4-hydroxy-3-methylbut-2-enyl diphosphate reductase [Muribaculaceae bacterium]|nr:4-hydroxy-3-methylbut-2-enyl diphosphate reductase [Muribaculaceae bacterium]
MHEIEIDNDSGFCFGVVTAINKAEEQLNLSERLYCLGDIVHNSDEVERLRNRGLETITHADLQKLSGVKVLLRAHGEPPSTYAIARSRDIEIIDATCPVVLALQKRIKETYCNAVSGLQIVIYGKSGHAEVNGLVGQTEGSAIVVEGIKDLDKLDYNRPIALYSQTTKSLDGYKNIIEEIRRRIAPGVEFQSFDTICRSVANRIPKIRHFAASHDAVIFVCGAKSSNGKILFAECREANPNTHMVTTVPDDIPLESLREAKSIGICGATSTPRWLMEQVRTYLLNTL